MSDKSDCQKRCEDSAKAFMEVEQALDRATRKLCKLMTENLETQNCFADCDDDTVCMHPNKFSDMHAAVGRAIQAVTGARAEIAHAHGLGDEICKDAGIIIVAGGGGGKESRVFNDLRTVEMSMSTRQRHFMA